MTRTKSAKDVTKSLKTSTTGELTKKSKPGTSSTKPENEFRLTSKEICSIIKASAKSGLKKLSYLGLELEFGSSAEPMAVSPQPNTPLEIVPPPDPKQLSLPDIEFQDEAAKKQYYEQLIVDDPVAYEKFMNEEDNAKARFRGVE